MHMGFMSTARFSLTSVVAVLVATLMTACGGGGGSAPAPGVSTSGGETPTAPTTSLQSHLANCPNTLTLNETVPCMVGQYQGKTTNNGATCSFVYDRDGVATYSAGGQTLRGSLDPLQATTVFEKKVASNSAGFSINWSVGSPSGGDLTIYYQVASEPTSANGLLIKPKNTSVPTCLVESGPAAAATGGGSTANALGRAWQTPQLLNGGNGAVGLFADQAAFDAGMADDGRAFITFRQSDAGGRMAVYVVEGRPGGAGQNPSWSAPQALDVDAPLLIADGFRPRLAVSANGHAVVMWAHQRACEADGYFGVNAGQTCRYVYAARRLASDTAWEGPVRVAAAPLSVNDYYARINTQGDIVLVFHGAKLPQAGNTFFNEGSDNRVVIARRRAVETSYRVERSEWIRRKSVLNKLSEWARVELDESGNITIAAETNDDFGAVVNLRVDMAQPLPQTASENASLTQDSAYGVYDLVVGATGYAAYTWKAQTGPYNARKPQQMKAYSPASRQWVNTSVISYAQWGDSNLAGTDNAEGEFLLYSGCKLTPWKAGTWGATRDLPSYCGRDQAGGVYAFNRKGDYLGINWAGKSGQWGYYSYAQNKMLKGAPGDGAAVAGDYVLGTPSNLFGAQPTQLLLAANGLALAVTTNTFTSLPSAANSVGVSTGSNAKLWAVYLK
jgi:hypothetical protein